MIIVTDDILVCRGGFKEKMIYDYRKSVPNDDDDLFIKKVKNQKSSQ